MADDKLKDKMAKEVKEALCATKCYLKDKLLKIKDKIKDIILNIKIFLASVVLTIYYVCKDIKDKLIYRLSYLYDTAKEKLADMYYNIVKYSKFIAYQACNYTLRSVGVVLKLPVHVLNMLAIWGNVVQMKANVYKSKAKLAKDGD